MKAGEIISDRYRILCHIGHGGTSEVYKAYDMHVKREVAMKIISTDKPYSYYLARSEADTLKSIKYPLFPAIYDVISDEGHVMIISEYIKGQHLCELMGTGKLSRSKQLKIIEQVAQAIGYLHDFEPPILYLDLKPENIIISENNLPVLVDFGIACRLMHRKVCMGTHGYSPPEQYSLEENALDKRADVYSLAMTFAALRCGKPPDKDYDTNIAFIKNSRLFGKLEKAFILKSISYDKADRFTDMSEVINQIKHIREYPRKMIKRFAILFTAVSCALLAVYLINNSRIKLKEKEAAFEMIGDAAQFMQDGEYTREGMEIIKTFVQSGCLNEKTEQEFIKEIAKNCLFIQHDYKTAAIYYSKLDADIYPTASEYAKLCRMLSGFNEEENWQYLVGIFYGDVIKMPFSENKYENILLISGLYEQYDEDEFEGISKSIAVLNAGIESLCEDGERNMSLSDKEVNVIKERLNTALNEKEERAKSLYLKNMKDEKGDI